MNKFPKLVLIEGLDLAGKSTISRAVGDGLEALGIIVRRQRNSLCAGNTMAEDADVLRKDPNRDLEKVGEMFLCAHRWDSQHFVLPEKGTLHLQDSCWMRTLAYCRFFGDEQTARLLREEALTFPLFGKAYFLTASLEQRRKRLAKREAEKPGTNDAGDAWVETRPADFLRLERTLEETVNEFLPAQTIDTSNLSIEQITQMIVNGIVEA